MHLQSLPRTVLFVFIFLFIVSCTSTGSTLVSSVGAVKVKDLIDEANITIKETTAALEAAGINVTTNAAESVNIATQNLKLSLDDSGNKLISELSKEQQALAVTLKRSINQAKEDVTKFTSFGDMALLSFEATINDSILSGFEGKSLVIQRVLGRSQLQSDNEFYLFSLVGTNLGTGEAEVSNSFKLSVEDRDIDFVSFGYSRHAREFKIPTSELEHYFDQYKATNLKLRLSIEQVYERKILKDKQIAHDFDINFSLFPKHAGSFTVTYQTPRAEWQNVERLIKTSTDSCHNCPTGKKVPLKLEVVGGDTGPNSVLGSERLVSHACNCKSSGDLCWYDENGNAGGHKLERSSNKNIVTCTLHHRTKTTTWELTATKQRYNAIEPANHRTTMQINFNEPSLIRVPVQAISLRIKSKLTTGETINVALDPLSDATGRVEVTGGESDGKYRSYYLTIKPDLG